MAVLPLSSKSKPEDAIRQIDLNFRELVAKLDTLEKRIKELENNS